VRPGAALAAIAMIMATPAAADAVADITAARAAYNAAITARDVAGVRAALGDGYVGIAGTNGEAIIGADAMAEYFARAFRMPGFLGFVRTPAEVRVANPPQRAMERGHWRGGTVAAPVHGEYLAVWVHSDAGWKLRSESFVTLGSGPAPAR
jgi:ketosteroid isomerase-like protein